MQPESHRHGEDPPRTRDLPSLDPLPLAAKERIDRVCLAFEDAWKAGQRPRIEDFLKDTAGPERSELLGELMRVELDYRRRAGEEPTPDDYHARFPNDAEMIDKVLRQPPVYLAEEPPGAMVHYFGDYELLARIAHGGMGVVYRARQMSLNRLVALKMIRESQLASPEAIERFHREAEAAAGLQHPNIVAIHEIGQHQGQHYFSMDYVEGQSLRELAGGTPLPAHRAAAYVQAIAEAVHYAHQQGTLHRDLKPANILIDRDDRPRITDFGLARRIKTDSGLTLAGEVLGTPSYMPPEQATGRWSEVGPASDVYALGATLYELAAGRPPFQGESATDTLLQVLDDEPIAPRLLNPKVPRDLETIALKCLEKESSRRYPTAEALADELGRFLRGEPIRARPIGRLERGWRWCKRNRRVAALATFAAALSLFLAVAGPIVAMRQASLRRDADRSAAKANLLASEKTELLGQTQQLLREKTNALAEAQIQRTRAEKGERTSKEEAGKALRAKRDAEDAERETRRTLYVADMNRLQDCWDSSNVGVVRLLLGRHVPKPGEEDLRSFEWYYWWRQAHREQRTSRHEGEVQWVAVSPDGKLLATAGLGGAVKLWDLQTGRLTHTLPGPSKRFAALAFSKDGRTLAVAGAHLNQVSTWEVISAEVVRPKGLAKSMPEAPIYRWCAAFSPDLDSCVGGGSYVGGSGDLAWRHVATAKEEKLPGAFAGVSTLARESGPAHSRVVIQSRGNTATGFLRQDDEGAPPPREYGGPIFCIAYSPDGKTVAAGGAEGTIKLWDLATRQEKATLARPERIVWALAFSPDGRTLASGGTDGVAVLWDLGTGRQVTVFEGHTGEIRSLVFLPGGRAVASAGADSTVRLWDLPTHQLRRTFLGHEAPVNCVRCSPDGRMLVSGGEDGTARVWNVADEEAVLHGESFSVLSGAAYLDEDRVSAVMTPQAPPTMANIWEPSPSLSAPTSREERHLWDLNTGEHRVLHLERPGVSALSAHGPATGAPGSYGAGVSGPFGGCTEYSSDRTIVALAGSDGTVTLRDLPGGQTRATLRILDEQGPDRSAPSAKSVTCLAFSADNKTLAVGTSTRDKTAGEIQLWDVPTGAKSATLDDTGGGLKKMAFSPDGAMLLAVCAKQVWDPAGQGWPRYRLELKRWDTAGDKHAGAPLEGDLPSLPDLRFSPRCSSVAATCGEEHLWVWEVASGRLKAALAAPLFPPVSCVTFSPDGKTLAAVLGSIRSKQSVWFSQWESTGIEANTIARWDVETGRARRPYKFLSSTGRKYSAAFSPGGKLLTAGRIVWDVATDKAWALGPHQVDLQQGAYLLDSNPKVLPGGRGSTYTVDINAHFRQGNFGAFSPDGETLATASPDGKIELWHAATGKEEGTLETKGVCCLALAFSPDGQTLAAAVDRSVQLWDVRRRALRSVLGGHTELVRSLAYSRDGTTLASASSDGSVRLWDAETGALRSTLRGHFGGVSCVAFSPDSKTVASAGRDGTVRLWDLRRGEEKAVLRGPSGWVTSVAFSPDGRILASAGDDGTVRLWRGASDAEVARAAVAGQ